jgi:hypothetical protein
MSKWGEERLSSNPENMLEQRARARSLDLEKRFVQPTAVEIDEEGRIFVVDSARHRIPDIPESVYVAAKAFYSGGITI